MNVSIHQRIRILIEETNDAFSYCGTVNADFAEFAVLSLSEFKHVLSNPHLTSEELTNILRRGMAKHQDKDKDPVSWAAFMAQHVASAANYNNKIGGFSGSRTTPAADLEVQETL